MISLRLAALSLCAGLLSVSMAQAEEKEWVLRVKHEANGLSLHLGGTTLVGQGARIKGSGVMVDKARAVAPFSKLRVEGPLDVRLVAAASEALRVRADDNIEPLIQSQVEGDTLVLSLKPGASFSTRQDLRVAVEFKQLQALQIKGSGDVRIEVLRGERFDADLSGSGDLEIGLLEVREFNARVSGSGDVSLAGRAEQQDFQLSGSGDVSAAALSGTRVRARLSGSGDLRLGVAQELDAELSGSGDLAYSGRPKIKSQIHGSGELISR